jgi:hypothetical protein
MKPAEIAGWVGAATGILSLLWNIYTKITAGPKIRGTAFANMIGVPPGANDARYLRIAVQNVGTAATTISNVGFRVWGTRSQRLLEWSHLRKPPVDLRSVLHFYQGSPLPHLLEAGGEWQAVVKQDARFEEWLKTDRLYCEAWHSFSTQPTRIKIIASAS